MTPLISPLSPIITPISPVLSGLPMPAPGVGPSTSTISLLSLCSGDMERPRSDSATPLSPTVGMFAPVMAPLISTRRRSSTYGHHIKIPDSPNLSPVSLVSSPSSFRLASPRRVSESREARPERSMSRPISATSSRSSGRC